ncbi:consortin [Hippocampus zosterae]|uniref:consortin n=1 Tax=Hippocampus zosterae TaxID=109293 RepID=UPI00223E3071|nr:consortin [Hippocampus zosterae]
MDHGGQLDNEGDEGKVMSQVVVAEDDCCDNKPHPEPHTAQPQNLNEINPATRIEQTSALQNDFGAGLPLKVSLNNNGEKKEELEKHKEEEQDTDELMKDEEEESEASSCQMHCQFPDTPMSDSSYSETGSLLENPFSPGTSPEPTSPVLQETSCPISRLELDRSQVDFGGLTSSTPGHALITGPLLSSHLSLTSDTGLSCTNGPEQISATTARNAHSTSEPLTASSPPIEGLACPSLSDLHLETTSVMTPLTSDAYNSQTAQPFAVSTGHATSAHSTSQMTPTHTDPYTSSSVPTISTLMASLEQLAKRGDDTCLPQDLHRIAEASVHHEDYQLALECIQLERLYHQRVLDNLNALQKQWESRCTRSLPSPEARHLDTLRDICQTHTRPNASDAASASLSFLSPPLEQRDALPPSARHAEGRMENRAEDSSCPQTVHPLTPSIHLSHGLDYPDEKDRESPECNLEGTDGFRGIERAKEEASGREQGECPEHTTAEVLHPSEAGQMDQTKPAEQQGGDLGSTQEKEVNREDERSNVGEAAEPLMMEDETEEEEGEGGTKAVGGLDVEVEHLHQETQEAEKEICQEIKGGNQSSLQKDDDDDAHLPKEALLKHPKRGSEEEEDEYEAERADFFPEAITLDDMAKLITVEEMFPASGLISILKKRNFPSDNFSMSASPKSRSNKPTTKRRVRFKVADDGFDSDVGGRDSCLLLFLLCLVTVVISMGGTTLYCALGDVHSSVCQDFSRNVDFYFGQVQRAVAQIHQWLGPSST